MVPFPIILPSESFGRKDFFHSLHPYPKVVVITAVGPSAPPMVSRTSSPVAASKVFQAVSSL